MKKLAIFFVAILACTAVSAQTITVYGYGPNREAAKLDAFKTAIENVCGSNVLSSKEFFNGNTVHNKVMAYSSCRVKKHRILEEIEGQVLVEVFVERLNLSDRITAQSNNRMLFDGDQLRQQLHSYHQEKISGDELITEIFRDYPYHAYELKPTKTPYMVNDAARNFYLIVPYDLRWNPNYVKVMRETMGLLSQPYGTGTVKIVGGKHKSFFSDAVRYNLNDIYRIDQIKDHMRGKNEVRLQIVARDRQGKHVIDLCYSPDYRAGGIFYSIGIPNNISIFGDDRQHGEVKVRLTMPADVIYDVYVDVVAERDCKL